MIARIQSFVNILKTANPLRVDGVYGPKTHAAVCGILKDVPFPKEGSCEKIAFALEALVRQCSPCPWTLIARSKLGLKEAPGDVNNEEILQMAELLRIPYAADSTAWCGLFLAYCISCTTESPLPAKPLRAQSWKDFGVHCVPQLGSILVFYRGKEPNVGSALGPGHVGFYVGENKSHFHVLGGNQNNMVCESKVAKSRLLDSRWPTGWPQPMKRVLSKKNLPDATES